MYYCDNNLSSLGEKYGLRGSNNIHNASCATVAIGRKSAVWPIVERSERPLGRFERENGRWPTVIMQTEYIHVPRAQRKPKFQCMWKNRIDRPRSVYLLMNGR